MSAEFKEGTYYCCGCWHGGKYWQHPEFCTTHHQPWKLRYHIREEEGVAVTIIDERMTKKEEHGDSNG